MSPLTNIITYITTAFAIVTVIVAILGFARTGGLTRIKIGRLGSIEIAASKADRDQARLLAESFARAQQQNLPFETEQLANYYTQVLAQSRISFWFSLIFASLGFLIIVIGGFRFMSADTGAAIIQLISGTVIDAVAALFFVQSNRAQSAMAAFFEKLRLDRQQLDGRQLCEGITDEATRNAVKVQLALYLSGIPKFDEISKSIVDACLAKRT